ncbi:nuclease-related domain-containing protein [Spirulina sp. CCNP1310]|uniref:nuclease-related domain-containing protein n=1 Tax=Spirulina sp. CCNP1310 TaxID=3110249 RepID=UPI002B221530|nr:nuclease-related domain-containing protein [Spirulina sp. CCNP1310]MEA5418037.1 nuclease-related domain-containing protein [Spirulina sp. CCNP1310]
MIKSNRRAGQNIRQLATKRRTKAMICFASGGVVLFFPLFLVKIINDFLKQISSLSSSQPQPSLNLPIIFYAPFIILAFASIANGVFLWKRANHADQGAHGEEDTAQAISPLEREGWQIEYGTQLGKSRADVDIICISPQGKAYVIDVKSHRGEVITDGTQLYRRLGHQSFPFEKHFLNQVKRQAVQVKEQKRLGFVTPILAFSNAKVLISSSRFQKVYVIEKSKLLQLLKSLG